MASRSSAARFCAAVGTAAAFVAMVGTYFKTSRTEQGQSTLAAGFDMNALQCQRCGFDLRADAAQCCVVQRAEAIVDERRVERRGHAFGDELHPVERAHRT